MIEEKLSKLNELSYSLERKVLSPVVMDFGKDKAVDILTNLSEEDFIKYGSVYRMIKKSIDSENNFSTLFSESGLPYSEFTDFAFGESWTKSISELKKVSLARQYLLKSYQSFSELDYKNIETTISKLVNELSRLSVFRGEKVDAKEGVTNFQKYHDEIKEKFKNGETTIGISTGYSTLDSLSEGILPRTLTILGGYAGAGKTSLAVNIIRNIIQGKKRVVMFSLEMGASEIFTKMIALGAELNPMKMLKGYLDDVESSRVEESKAELYELGFEVYGDLKHFDKIRMAMIKESLVRKPDLFVIDYLQLIQDSKYKTAQERLSNIVNELKAIAKQVDVPILAISSISNDSARNQNDEVGGYKGSGDIEYASDLALKLINVDNREQRDDLKKSRKPVYVDLLITKQRNGATGAIQMSFESYIGKLTEGRKIR